MNISTRAQNMPESPIRKLAKYADAASAYEEIITLDPLPEEERGKAKRGLVICYDWLRTQTTDKALKQEYERKFNQLWEELMN